MTFAVTPLIPALMGPIDISGLIQSAIPLLITVGVLAFVLLVRKGDIPEVEPESPARHLEDRKAIIYENLRDLNFEFRLGKLSEEDYQKTKLGLQQELAQVLAEIDRVMGAAPAHVEKKADPLLCPHCGARFATALKFCGECGKPMGEAR
jgi:hypothetical protein